MTECTNETMRERLPALQAGALSAAEATALRAHLAACPACASEWDILVSARALFTAAAPPVDLSAIVAKLPAPPTARPALRVERGGGRPFRVPRYVLAAAASVVLVATLSLTALRPLFFSASTPTVEPSPVESGTPAVAAAPSALVGARDLSELDVDELTTLLAELDRIEATVASEPMTLRQPLVAVPEGL